MYMIPRLLAGLFLATILFSACKSTQKASQAAKNPTEPASPVLLSFPNAEVTKAEFERVYAKNNGGPEAAADHTTEQYREYLDLYINFKRKVFEAEAMGLDTTPAFRQEFGSYRKQLAQPYLSAKEVEEQLVEEAYDRSQYIVNASHILIRVGENASPTDTLAAYQRIVALRDSVVNQGKDFGEMASKYSEDPSAADNGGDLGFFSVFDMVYPFENAAFETPVGEVSPPVRSRFGYHIVMVHDKRNMPGKKRAAHLMIRIGERYSAKDSAQADKIIGELYAKLQAGEDWEQLVGQYSDDPNTARRGGDLGFGRLLPEMESRKLDLGAGEFSEPFNTAYGWHILKVTEIDSLPPIEEARAQLLSRISSDSRSQLSRQAVISKIKKENDYQVNRGNFEAFKMRLNERFETGSWNPDSSIIEMRANTLFTLGQDTAYTLGSLIDFYTRTRPRHPGLGPEAAAEAVLKAYTDQALMAYEEAHLPEKNDDFRYLLQEYHDGILLFTLMERKVWKKAVEDTAGLRQYYLDHPDEFQAGEMVKVTEYRSNDAEAMDELIDLLEKDTPQETIDSLLNRITSLRVRITQPYYEKTDPDLPEGLFDLGVGQRTDLIEQNGYYRLMVVEEKLPAGLRPFESAKAMAITKYQDYLEGTWLEELAEKYPVEIKEDVFEALYQ